MPTENEENKPKAAGNGRQDQSFWIAILAIAISIIGTLVSVYEARIMRQQQALLTEQKSASVWPYILTSNTIDYMAEEGYVRIIHSMVNKGIGPAILGDVDYVFAEKAYESYSIDEGILAEYPDLDIEVTQNYQVDNIVLSAGDQVRVFTLLIRPEGKLMEFQQVANKIANQYESQFCYCSVYGDCWQPNTKQRAVTPTNDCQVSITF